MPLPSAFAESYGPWALVTGASAGIGLQYAHQLAATGLNIVLVADREAELATAAHEIKEEYNVETKFLCVDLAEEHSFRDVLTMCEGIDIGLLVNNAGIQLHGSIFRDPVEQHMKLVDLNCRAVVALTHSFGRKMVDRKRGGIIFTSSIFSTPVPFFASYSASKGFLTCFARAVREEFVRYNVQVTVVEPGAVDTDMARKTTWSSDSARGAVPLQTPEDCVRESLAAFANGKVKHVAGLGNRLSMGVLRTLPEPVQMAMMVSGIDKLISPEVRKLD